MKVGRWTPQDWRKLVEIVYNDMEYPKLVDYAEKEWFISVASRGELTARKIAKAKGAKKSEQR